MRQQEGVTRIRDIAMMQMSVLVRQASALLIGNLTTRPRDSGLFAKKDTRYSRAI